MDKPRARFLKQKSVRFCSLDGHIYWKYSRGILFNCLAEYEDKKVMKVFNNGDCVGRHYWKTTVNKILRASFYWPAMFFDVHKEVASCH